VWQSEMLLFIFSVPYTLNTVAVSNDDVSDVSFLAVCLYYNLGGVVLFC